MFHVALVVTRMLLGRSAVRVQQARRVDCGRSPRSVLDRPQGRVWWRRLADCVGRRRWVIGRPEGVLMKLVGRARSRVVCVDRRRRRSLEFLVGRACLEVLGLYLLRFV